jgi:hypothetical protein
MFNNRQANYRIQHQVPLCWPVLLSQVRLLAGQLRDAQNLISLKDRAGAWRNPAADAETQVSNSRVLGKHCTYAWSKNVAVSIHAGACPWL